MDATVIAGLVKAQAPEHAQCRAQEALARVVGDDGDSVIVQCACNVSLTLAVPKAAAPEPTKADNAPKVADDGS